MTSEVINLLQNPGGLPQCMMGDEQPVVSAWRGIIQLTPGVKYSDAVVFHLLRLSYVSQNAVRVAAWRATDRAGVMWECEV